MNLIPLSNAPPRPRYRTSAIGEKEAEQAIEMFNAGRAPGGVSDGAKLKSRAAASGRAKRLKALIEALDPEGKYRIRTWQNENGRYQWAVLRQLEETAHD